MYWHMGIEAAGKTGNSTQVEIQQKVKVQQNWKFKIVSVCPSGNLLPPILQICTLIVLLKLAHLSIED